MASLILLPGLASTPFRRPVLHSRLSDEGLEAVAHGVLFGREEMMLIHIVDDVLPVTARNIRRLHSRLQANRNQYRHS